MPMRTVAASPAATIAASTSREAGGECAELSRLVARENEGSNKRSFGRAEGL